MADFITLTCPSCGGKLQITNEINRFACAFCGNEHVVGRQRGVVFLQPLTDELRNIQLGTDKTASELAIARLNNEIREIEQAKKEIKQRVFFSLENSSKMNDVKTILASRRNSVIERSKFKRNASIEVILNEIINLSQEEYEGLKKRYPASLIFPMVRTNLETIRKFELDLNTKRNQIARHQKIVNQ